jgi:hypothetical protein
MTRLRDVLGGDAAALDLGDSDDRDAHPGDDLLLGQAAVLAHLGEPPAAGVVEHRADGGVEGLLAAGGFDGALQVAGVAPAGHAAHVPVSFPVVSLTAQGNAVFYTLSNNAK